MHKIITHAILVQSALFTVKRQRPQLWSLHDLVASRCYCLTPLSLQLRKMYTSYGGNACDMTILAPSWYAMLKILELHCHKLDIKKTVCMMFKPIRKACIVSQAFPPFTLNNYLSGFRYLGHIINDRLQDDCDIRCEIRSLFAWTNLLINKFGNCSYEVKKLLFKSYCLCMYNLALWKYYSVTVFNKFKSCYNRCVKIFFGFYRVTLC